MKQLVVHGGKLVQVHVPRGGPSKIFCPCVILDWVRVFCLHLPHKHGVMYYVARSWSNFLNVFLACAAWPLADTTAWAAMFQQIWLRLALQSDTVTGIDIDCQDLEVQGYE